MHHQYIIMITSEEKGIEMAQELNQLPAKLEIKLDKFSKNAVLTITNSEGDERL